MVAIGCMRGQSAFKNSEGGMNLKNIMTCLQKITWGGKVCYGKRFTIYIEKDKKYAECNHCGHKHEI